MLNQEKKCPSPANNWSVRCNNYAQSVSTSFYWFQKRRASSEWPYAIYLDSFAKIFWCQNFLSVNMKPLLNYVNFIYLVLAKLSLNGDLDSIYMRGEFMLQQRQKESRAMISSNLFIYELISQIRRNKSFKNMIIRFLFPFYTF